MDAIGAFDLTKVYTAKGTGRDVAALQSINLQVPQGRAMACVGPESSGKTTLVRVLSGLLRPTSGECSVLGLSPAFETARLHGMMGTVLFSAKLYADLSLWDNMLFFAGVHYVQKNDGMERASFLLHRLNLWDERELSPRQLSTGMLKRASLARALIHRPRVLLMDEQGAGMDLETARLVRELLQYVLREEGVTLLLCTQNMNFAQTVCHNFGLLHQGTLMARGDLESLRIGSGVRLKASLRLADGQKGPEGFRRQADGQGGTLWQRELQSQEEMPKLIAQVVGQGSSLYEAQVLRPSLEEIYQAHLEGGRRREAVIHGETRVGQAGQPAVQSTAQPAAAADVRSEA